MKRTLIAAALIVACLLGSAETKKLNQGFLKKAAKTVWGMDMPQFDPKMELTDTIFNGASAANIAVYYFTSAERHEMTTLRDGRVPPREWRLGETECVFLTRYMVKIMDEKGLEHHTQFEFQPSEIERLQQIVMFDVNNAFGARIFKPDGRVIDVDMKQVLTESTGKKGKEAVQHKIAIPGLEVGDVLDYFYYTELYFLGNQECQRHWTIMSEYPSASFLVEARIDPSLTTVVNAFNGLEAPERGVGSDQKTYFKWEQTNLPAFKRPAFCQLERQLPIMRVYVADNISCMLEHRNLRRRPGVFFNPTAQSSLPEIAEYYNTRKWEGYEMSRAASLMKSYKEAHPQASVTDIADAAYMATRYVTELSKSPFSGWDMAAFMKDLLDKQDIDSLSYLGVANPRHKIELKYISSYRHTYPMVAVAGKYYFFNNNISLAPGEIPPEFGGEPLFKLAGKRKDMVDNFFFFIDLLPKETAAANSAVFNVKVSVDDPDETWVNLSYSGARKGNFKSLAGDIVEEADMVEAYEQLLGVPGKVLEKKGLGKLKKNRFDMAQLEDDQKKKLEEIHKADLGISVMEVDSMIVDDFGFSVEQPEFRYRLSGKVDDVLAPAGDDIILGVGKLAQMVELTDTERGEKNREISIITVGPYNRRVNMIIDVPEDYNVKEESLAELARNASGRAGLFISQIKYDAENRQIHLTLMFRNPAAIYSPALWDDFRKVREEAASFNEASIVFHKD